MSNNIEKLKSINKVTKDFKKTLLALKLILPEPSFNLFKDYTTTNISVGGLCKKYGLSESTVIQNLLLSYDFYLECALKTALEYDEEDINTSEESLEEAV